MRNSYFLVLNYSIFLLFFAFVAVIISVFTTFASMNERKGCVATVGFFDGVHRGHQYLIGQVKEIAKATGRESAVITFDRHPRQVLHSDYQPKLLSSLDVKELLLSRQNVDRVEVLHFDEALAGLSAHDFMRDVLRDEYRVECLVLGYDNRFGRRNGVECFDDYVAYGKELGMEVVRAKEWRENMKVSSSQVRRLLEKGDIDAANACLGYNYTIVGKVVEGHQNGRQMGFPTANIDTKDWGQLIPAAGVYAVRVRRQRSMTLMRGMMNIGSRPTFDGDNQTLEVNIFDFRDDIYNEMLLVSFVKKIRDEHRFDSPDDLAHQLERDRMEIEQIFDKETDDE